MAEDTASAQKHWIGKIRRDVHDAYLLIDNGEELLQELWDRYGENLIRYKERGKDVDFSFMVDVETRLGLEISDVCLYRETLYKYLFSRGESLAWDWNSAFASALKSILMQAKMNVPLSLLLQPASEERQRELYDQMIDILVRKCGYADAEDAKSAIEAYLSVPF